MRISCCIGMPRAASPSWRGTFNPIFFTEKSKRWMFLEVRRKTMCPPVQKATSPLEEQSCQYRSTLASSAQIVGRSHSFRAALPSTPKHFYHDNRGVDGARRNGGKSFREFCLREVTGEALRVIQTNRGLQKVLYQMALAREITGSW